MRNQSNSGFTCEKRLIHQKTKPPEPKRNTADTREFLGAQLLGRFAKMLHELVDVPGVGVDRGRRFIADPHVFCHPLGQWRQAFAIRGHGSALLPGNEFMQQRRRIVYP